MDDKEEEEEEVGGGGDPDVAITGIGDKRTEKEAELLGPREGRGDGKVCACLARGCEVW